ncbi:MAG: sigma-70 family RNA polymerase sigma factor [Gemmatimonadales bacterium]
MDLEALFEQHQPALLRYLTRYTGDSEEAADAAQETYLRLVERPPPRTHNIRAWLFTVATNVVRDERRRQRADDRMHAAVARIPSAVRNLPPDVLYEQAERRRMVHRMLEQLSEKERTILLMWEGGFSHPEIAEAVGWEWRSIGPSIARSLRKLSGDIRRLKEGFR